MRKIIVSEFVSLDGVMEGPGAADPFEFAGWTMKFANEEFAAFKHDELFAADALLLGRVTYDGFAAAWPALMDAGDFGERMNSIKKYVVTDSLDKAEWNNTSVVKGDVVEQIKKLKALPGSDILVFGSSILLQTLIKERLVDEYNLLLYPVVLGVGKKLFKDGARADLKLLEERTFKTGVVLLRYETL